LSGSFQFEQYVTYGHLSYVKWRWIHRRSCSVQ